VIEVKRKGNDLQGELVDIKPYFPCEEVVEGTMNKDELDQESFTPISFQEHPIGEYLFVNHHGMIQMRVSESLSGEEIENALGQIKAGDYIRVLWWFHKFDDHKYRSHLMCNPPYKNAPKSGVFATRSPVRPNPLASTIVKVESVDRYNHNLTVLGFDGFEHSLVLQIMPYQDDLFRDVSVPTWVGILCLTFTRPAPDVTENDIARMCYLFNLKAIP
jgi:tRNA (Thr-GGU) A37 N-methylase